MSVSVYWYSACSSRAPILMSGTACMKNLAPTTLATSGLSRAITSCTGGRSANGFSWMNMRAVFSLAVAARRAGEADDAGDGRILEDDGGEFVLDFRHRVEGDVLARLRHAHDDAGVLLG